jgi:hypothetical protein
MVKIFFVALAGVVLLTGQRAFAEESMSKCTQDFTECLARITVVNDLEVSDAKAACKQAYQACKKKVYAVEEQEQEQPAAEPQGNDTVNGNIKKYRFDK